MSNFSGSLHSKYGINLQIAQLKMRPNLSIDGSLQPQEVLEHAVRNVPKA